MPMKVSRKAELYRKLGQLAPAMLPALDKANHQAADEMAGMAQRLVPRKTGKLRDSIVVTPPGQTPPSYSQGGGGAVVPEGAYAVSAGNTKVRYAHLVEYGTKPHKNAGLFAGTDNPGAPAQPFFWPAYRATRKKQKSRATRAINKAVKEVAAK